MKRQSAISLTVIFAVLVGLGVALWKAKYDDDNLQKIGERGVHITSGMTANDAMGYKTKTFKVSGTDDPLWQSTIFSTVTAVKGTQSVSHFDPPHGTVDVVYDPNVTSEDKLAAALNATKFQVLP